MARPGSQQIAGYYPTPPSLLPSIAALLCFPADHATAYLLDPCAGDGTAIRALRDLWAESRPLLDDDWPTARRLPITAAELEEARATALAEALDATHYTHGDRAHHADAFRLYPEMPASTGATVLFLNPPYDHDPEHRRLEHRFLLRFTAHLHPGAGVLLYVVPHYALEPSAEFLARNYLDLRAYRFPDPEYQAFRQVVLLGRRARRPLTSSTFAATILRWAQHPETLPVLPDRCSDPLAIDPDPDPAYDLCYRVEDLDLTAALSAFRPWEGTPTGVAHAARDLLGARFETAVPPRPAHIALALASGMFNGHRLDPNSASDLDPAAGAASSHAAGPTAATPTDPPLLAKGVFERVFVEVSRKVTAEGATASITEIEQPRLRLTILRLDTYTFHTLAPGIIPTGADDPAAWNAADLITRYDRSENQREIQEAGRQDAAAGEWVESGTGGCRFHAEASTSTETREGQPATLAPPRGAPPDVRAHGRGRGRAGSSGGGAVSARTARSCPVLDRSGAQRTAGASPPPQSPPGSRRSPGGAPCGGLGGGSTAFLSFVPPPTQESMHLCREGPNRLLKNPEAAGSRALVSFPGYPYTPRKGFWGTLHCLLRNVSAVTCPASHAEGTFSAAC